MAADTAALAGIIIFLVTTGWTCRRLEWRIGGSSGVFDAFIIAVDPMTTIFAPLVVIAMVCSNTPPIRRMAKTVWPTLMAELNYHDHHHRPNVELLVKTSPEYQCTSSSGDEYTVSLTRTATVRQLRLPSAVSTQSTSNAPGQAALTNSIPSLPGPVDISKSSLHWLSHVLDLDVQHDDTSLSPYTPPVTSPGLPLGTQGSQPHTNASRMIRWSDEDAQKSVARLMYRFVRAVFYLALGCCIRCSAMFGVFYYLARKSGESVGYLRIAACLVDSCLIFNILFARYALLVRTMIWYHGYGEPGAHWCDAKGMEVEKVDLSAEGNVDPGCQIIISEFHRLCRRTGRPQIMFLSTWYSFETLTIWSSFVRHLLRPSLRSALPLLRLAFPNINVQSPTLLVIRRRWNEDPSLSQRHEVKVVRGYRRLDIDIPCLFTDLLGTAEFGAQLEGGGKFGRTYATICAVLVLLPTAFVVVVGATAVYEMTTPLAILAAIHLACFAVSAFWVRGRSPLNARPVWMDVPATM